MYRNSLYYYLIVGKHIGPWANTTEAAIANALSEVNTKEDEWIRVGYPADSIVFVPIKFEPKEGIGKYEIRAETIHSPARNQYRTTLYRETHYGDGN